RAVPPVRRWSRRAKKIGLDRPQDVITLFRSAEVCQLPLPCIDRYSLFATKFGWPGSAAPLLRRSVAECSRAKGNVLHRGKGFEGALYRHTKVTHGQSHSHESQATVSRR